MLKKRQITEITDIIKRLREIGKIKKIINDCKKIGLVTEIEENVFQINPESPNFEVFKKILERKRREEEMREK